MRQIKAIRALRMNYRWRGVYMWLKDRYTYTDGLGNYSQLRGWQLILWHADDIRAEQEAIAEGVFS
jgi:hypothetical protein